MRVAKCSRVHVIFKFPILIGEGLLLSKSKFTNRNFEYLLFSINNGPMLIEMNECKCVAMA